MSQGGQSGEVAGRQKVRAVSADRACDVHGQDSSSGYSVGKDIPNNKGEGGVQVHRVVRGTVENLVIGSKLSAEN